MTEETENRSLLIRGRYDLTVPERSLIERGLALAESLVKKEYTCPILGAKFVLIPAGTFMMGEVHEQEMFDALKQRQVTISKPFYMQTTPVTQGQWQMVMVSNPSHFKGDDRLPVESVSWNDVQHFIGKLNGQEGMDKYRLPTEAEWEYACRAGSTTAYYFGDDPSGLDEYAWYDANSKKMTHHVGHKKPNAWGLYDMYGNVEEWCQDWYGGHYIYNDGPVINPKGPSSGDERVIRGGAWDCWPENVHASRFSNEPDESGFGRKGFRLLRALAVSDSPSIDKSTAVYDAIEPSSDGRFIAYDNGTVLLDTKTNLMWLARFAGVAGGLGTNWANAEAFCQNYRGGGYSDWRMPTQDELEGLYESGCHEKLIEFFDWFVWASETRGSDAAYFYFPGGKRGWGRQSIFYQARALPVRSGK